MRKFALWKLSSENNSEQSILIFFSGLHSSKLARSGPFEQIILIRYSTDFMFVSARSAVGKFTVNSGKVGKVLFT